MLRKTYLLAPAIEGHLSVSEPFGYILQRKKHIAKFRNVNLGHDTLYDIREQLAPSSPSFC